VRFKISGGKVVIPDVKPESGASGDAKLAAFNKHKLEILALLRKEYERGPKIKPFDEERAWRSLTVLAGFYFVRTRAKQATTPAAQRIERLRDIAKVLSAARRLVNRTMQTDVGDDLFSAWWEVTGSEYAKSDGTFDPHYMEREFKQIVKNLGVLENAALLGADHLKRSKRGKPPVLTRDDIWNLGAIYRENTGRIPPASDGPFAKFVMKFLVGTDRADDIEYESLVEAIKAARRWALQDPMSPKWWGPSPFDEEAKFGPFD
jgi:hypothetical protein